MRKENRVYYFSVEGQTEKWYLDWLQNKINADQRSKYNVKLDAQVKKDPVARAKGLSILGPTEITHIFDRESEEKIHVDQFQKTLERMSDVKKLGKQIKYSLGYSNFTFELWIILHKMDFNKTLAHRSQYLAYINQAYEECFENLNQYKHQDNFERVLRKLTLEDVRFAVKRAKKIMLSNQEKGYILQSYKGYVYYRENPSLSLGDKIEQILRCCELL